MSSQEESSPQQLALIIQEPGKPHQVIAKFLMMILNYRYGLDLIVAHNFVEAFSTIQKKKNEIRATFIIQRKKIDSSTSLAALNAEDTNPLFLVLPAALMEEHKILCHRMKNVYFGAWEKAFGAEETSLQSLIKSAFDTRGIGDLFKELEGASDEDARERIVRRLKNLNTLPTLPEIAMRIMGMVDEPSSSAEDLEELVVNDPAILHKMLQLVNSPVFAGSGHQGGWSLKEAIVRLGRKKVGAVAQQIKLMNGLVRPEESMFDLRRFWEHSVGCAMIADRLYSNGIVKTKKPLQFNDYWIGALLHDIGKIVLGFFFWDHYVEILRQMSENHSSFRQAEKLLGDAANHEYLGKLLLVKSNVGKELADAVGAHDSVGQAPGDLVCLIHVANNVSKELDLGYMPEEEPNYNPEVLKALGLDKSRVGALRGRLGDDVVAEIGDVVDHCTQPQ